ncbi:MAG: DUF2141 domain-containing protein [Saprospiraceae bacterium]
MNNLAFLLIFLFLFLREPVKDSLNTPIVGDYHFHLFGLTPNRGKVRVVLYNDPKLFLSQYGFYRADSAFVSKDGTADIFVRNLVYGKYAGTFYQDENVNYIIDRNAVGLPIEPFAFSNGVRAKWKIPAFENVSFDFNKSNNFQKVQLNYWYNQ